MRPQLWKILFCISFGGLLPRISLAKPLTAHTSFISLPSCPFSSLGDDHHICCHPGISFLPQVQMQPHTTHRHIPSCVEGSGASACAGNILLTHLPPSTIHSTMLPCGSGNVDWWPGHYYGVHKYIQWVTCALLPQADTPEILLGRSLMHLSPPKKQINTWALLRIWIHFQKLLCI